MESREKRRVEKPRLPRTATKINPKTVATEMKKMGVDMKDMANVCELSPPSLITWII